MRLIVIIILLLVGVLQYLFQGWYIEQCCSDNSMSIAIEKDSIDSITSTSWSGPIGFAWGSDSVVTNQSFSNLRDSIVGSIADNQILEIVGWYDKDELPDSNDVTLGLSRAGGIRALFNAFLDSSRLVILGEERNISMEPIKGLFRAHHFSYRIRTKKIVEIEDRTLIYFPYNSTAKVEDEEIEAYLLNVAKRVVESGEVVELIGHTDSFGDKSSNYRLGLYRAEVIRDELMSHGVPSRQLRVSSQGEVDPIASNRTKEGRSKNRRTELIIVQN